MEDYEHMCWFAEYISKKGEDGAIIDVCFSGEVKRGRIRE